MVGDLQSGRMLEIAFAARARGLFRSALARALRLLALAALALGASSACAALGGGAPSVELDRIALHAQSRAERAPLYTVGVLTLPSGTLVREYQNAQGVVFAVSWSGPGKPDLRQTLGASFDTMVAETARVGFVGHAQLHIVTPGLEVHSVGHMRSFHGIAFLPALVPAGVEIGGLQ